MKAVYGYEFKIPRRTKLIRNLEEQLRVQKQELKYDSRILQKCLIVIKNQGLSAIDLDINHSIPGIEDRNTTNIAEAVKVYLDIKTSCSTGKPLIKRLLGTGQQVV